MYIFKLGQNFDKILMIVVAFVPIRLNCKRVVGKNLKLLGGKPLMCHILGTLTMA